MDDLLTVVDPHIVLLIAAIAVALLVIRWLLKVLSASWGILLAIVVIILVLQYGFGITPNQLLTEIGKLPQELFRLVQNFNLPNLDISNWVD